MLRNLMVKGYFSAIAASFNKSLKGVRIRSLDSLNRRMLRILRAACVCPLALR
jgi:hypothetical protein